MNNKDIKNCKIDLIKSEMGTNNKINSIKSAEELKNIFDNDKLDFFDDLFCEYLESLGKNIKHYNIILNYYGKAEDTEKKMTEIKKNINDKIKKFYDCDIDEKNAIKLLYFSTKKQYDLESFLKIVQYIPFKYYTTKVVQDENNKNNYYVKIDYAFPLVEEIVNEILENIFHYDLYIYNTLCDNKLIEAGARGQMFEKLITFYLNPKALNQNRKKFFKDINITDTQKMKFFVPRKNIDEVTERKHKIHLEKGTYLFTQKILTGKAFDILIVTIDNANKAQVIAFQITIHKPDDKIYKEGTIRDPIISLCDTLVKKYDFLLSNKNVFFSYIFDKTYEKKEKKLYDNMISKCKKEKMPYMVFDPKELIFYDKEGQKTENLKNNVISFFAKNKIYLRADCDSLECDDFLRPLDKPCAKEKFPNFCKISDNEIKKTINFLNEKQEYNGSIKSLIFLRTILCGSKEDLKKDKIYFGRTKTKKDLFIIYYSKMRNLLAHKFLNKKEENEGKIDEAELYAFDEYSIEY